MSSTYQREARPFATLFALIVLSLQKLKKEKRTIDMTNIKPVKSPSKAEGDLEISSICNESEGPAPKESCDETNSYYNNGSKYIPSSAEPTPEQPKIKKSPVKQKRSTKSPSKVFVKKDYLSSDNQSTGEFFEFV